MPSERTRCLRSVTLHSQRKAERMPIVGEVCCGRESRSSQASVEGLGWMKKFRMNSRIQSVELEETKLDAVISKFSVTDV